MAFTPTVCTLSRAEFLQHAKDLPIKIADLPPLDAEVKQFSTGSLGWNLNGKTKLTINGHEVKVQIGLNLTIIGSKELPS
jgi:hypothetical protein